MFLFSATADAQKNNLRKERHTGKWYAIICRLRQRNMLNSEAPVYPENDATKVIQLYPDVTESENKSLIQIPASEFYALDPMSYVPNSNAVSFMMEFLQSGGNLSENRTSHDVKYAKTLNAKCQPVIRRVSNNARAHSIEITVDGKDYLPRSRNNVWFQKLLLYFLIRSNRQNNPKDIGFPLQTLVDMGLYSSLDNARRGVNAFFKYQEHFHVEQEDTKETYHGGVLFCECTIKGNFVTFSRNTDVDFLTEYITVLPSFVFHLSPAAFVLTYYIFSVARQRTAQISAKSCFTLSLRGICERLALPSRDKVKNRKYREKIRLPIESAVKEINDAARGFADGNLKLKIVSSDGSIQQWLDGYLEIQMDGAYAAVFDKIAKSKSGKIMRFAAAKEAEAEKIAARVESKNKKTPDPVQPDS